MLPLIFPLKPSSPEQITDPVQSQRSLRAELKPGDLQGSREPGEGMKEEREGPVSHTRCQSQFIIQTVTFYWTSGFSTFGHIC